MYHQFAKCQLFRCKIIPYPLLFYILKYKNVIRMSSNSKEKVKFDIRNNNSLTKRISGLVKGTLRLKKLKELQIKVTSYKIIKLQTCGSLHYFYLYL